MLFRSRMWSFSFGDCSRLKILSGRGKCVIFGYLTLNATANSHLDIFFVRNTPIVARDIQCDFAELERS